MRTRAETIFVSCYMFERKIKLPLQTSTKTAVQHEQKMAANALLPSLARHISSPHEDLRGNRKRQPWTHHP